MELENIPWIVLLSMLLWKLLKRKKDKHREFFEGEDEMEPSLDSTSGKNKCKHAHSCREDM